MKRMKTILIRFCLTIIFIFAFSFSSKAEESETNSILSEEISDEAVCYAESVMGDYIDAYISISNPEKKVEIYSNGDFYLESGYYTYILENNQLVRGDWIDFPIVQNGEIILILQVSKVDNTWISSISEGYSDEMNSYLNSRKTQRPSFLVYSNENLYIFNDFEIAPLKIVKEDDEIPDYKRIEKNPIFDNAKITNINVYKADNEFKYSNIQNADIMNKLTKSSVPGFNIYESNHKVLEMANCLCSQIYANGEQAPNCWAAAAASIIRYKTGNRWIESYHLGTEGGSLEKIFNALVKFNAGSGYSILYRGASLITEVYHNINNRFPFVMSGYRYSMSGEILAGHAVTAIGYADDVLIYWNSANRQQVLTKYQGVNTTYFSTGSLRYKWEGSVLAPLS